MILKTTGAKIRIDRPHGGERIAHRPPKAARLVSLPRMVCVLAKGVSFGASMRRRRAFSTCNRLGLPRYQEHAARHRGPSFGCHRSPGATADPANRQGTGISRWHPDNDRGRSSHSRPRPGVEGFYFASGCNVAGLSISPTVGEALAAWIVDGKPPMDLAPMSVARFPQKSPSTHGTRTVAARRSSTARSSALSLILLAFRLATIAPELLIPSTDARVARKFRNRTLAASEHWRCLRGALPWLDGFSIVTT